MMNFHLVVVTVLYWGRFLEGQRDVDVMPTLGNYENIHSVNPLYLIIHSAT